jgi:hypothetical protein
MLYLLLKAALSGAIVAAVSEVAKRWPGFGGLIASLPLVSVLGMIWLWRDTEDTGRISAYVTGALWFFAPSIPMFFLIPYLLKRGIGFWPALASGCLLTIALYSIMVALAPRFGVRL